MKVASALLALLCLATVSAKDKKAEPVGPLDDKTLVLPPVKIEGRPSISFAVDIAIYVDATTKKVSRLFITRVEEDSDAEHAGLKAGDEIVKLEGVPVKEMDARVAADSPLGRLLLNRTPGAALDLEVIVRRTQNLTLRAQKASAFDAVRP